MYMLAGRRLIPGFRYTEHDSKYNFIKTKIGDINYTEHFFMTCEMAIFTYSQLNILMSYGYNHLNRPSVPTCPGNVSHL